MLHSEPIYAATGISQHATFIDTQRGIAVVERSSAPMVTAVLLVLFAMSWRDKWTELADFTGVMH